MNNTANEREKTSHYRADRGKLTDENKNNFTADFCSYFILSHS
jgi:hypothetical protein